MNSEPFKISHDNALLIKNYLEFIGNETIKFSGCKFRISVNDSNGFGHYIEIRYDYSSFWEDPCFVEVSRIISGVDCSRVTYEKFDYMEDAVRLLLKYIEQKSLEHFINFDKNIEKKFKKNFKFKRFYEK